jgi:hypothetical protein
MPNNLCFTAPTDTSQRSTKHSSKRQRSSIANCSSRTNRRLNGAIKSYTEGTTNADGQPDPQKSGAVLTYGPYDEPPSAIPSEKIDVHFEFTAPITYVDHFERDIEVSHWGNNVAIEERYQLTNHAAKSSSISKS